MPSARASERPDPLWEQLRVELVTALGELDLSHQQLADACGASRQNVGQWVSPNKDASPSLVYVARMAASDDERARALGLRLLRAVAAHADADLTDLRSSDGELMERLDAMDREGFEARHALRSAHADGSLDDDELANIAQQADEAATRYRGEANGARAELQRRRRQRSGERGRAQA